MFGGCGGRVRAMTATRVRGVLNWGIYKQLGFQAGFIAGMPWGGDYGEKAIELFKNFEEFGDECD